MEGGNVINFLGVNNFGKITNLSHKSLPGLM